MPREKQAVLFRRHPYRVEAAGDIWTGPVLSMSASFRMLDLRLIGRLLLALLVLAALLTVWMDRWKAELIAPLRPLLQLDGSAPGATPRQTVRESPTGQPPSDGDRHPAPPLPAGHQPAAGVSSQVIRLPAGPAPATSPHANRTILYWNSTPGGVGYEPFVGCAHHNCVVTSDRSRLGEADAVLFHMVNGVGRLPPRRPHQRFVFLLRESPELAPVRAPRYRGAFNLTMTYRRDSDVLIGYFSVLRGAEPTPLPAVGSRSKAVAWIVSHCKTASGRELYVEQLKRFIDVDVYGRCGTLRCPPKAECHRMVGHHYHFYLAFENSQCRDYVTEKLYLPLRYGLVPVVLGDNRTLYEEMAPPGSFIHIDDFAGPQQLAEYLHYLMTNRTAFSQYFDWRRRHRIVRLPKLCDLCRYLNEPHPAQYYDDIGRWWRDGGACHRRLALH